MKDGEPQMNGYRKKITPATQAALWALSSGYCYAPRCKSPVVVEIRPGIYEKNAQIAHIHGVRAPRHNASLTAEQCAEFSNLLVLCLAHHSAVDNRLTGERFYPPVLLRSWKEQHEGNNAPALADLGSVNENTLIEMILDAFTPPLERLEQIANQLEETGTLNAQTVMELRQVIDVMSTTSIGLDSRLASALVDAAGIFGSRSFNDAATALTNAADILPSYNRALTDKISELREVADLITSSSRRMGGYM